MEEPVNVLDPETFESLWENLSEDGKARLIEKSMDLDPSLAILPVLEGLLSFHFNVRNQARKGLDQIQKNMHSLLKAPADQNAYVAGLKISESVCARIYSQIIPNLPFAEISFFLKMLLELQGKGPFFAFKVLYKGVISAASMGKVTATVSEDGRLALVDQYLRSAPSVRLKYGKVFKGILESIETRDSVVLFYAGLFDRQQDADPFLNNIHPVLRDPKTIIATELKSESPEIKIMGLKALSMIVNRIPEKLLLDILATEEVVKVRMAIYAIIENSTMGVYGNLFYPILQLLKKCGKKEGMCAFKALIVSGKVPPYTLFEMIREHFPDLMPGIKLEISSLSKISFFIIQDIALNKEKYLDGNFEINQACVLGMIKKRPERVVRILKKYDNVPDDQARMHVTRFIEKTKILMAREKKDIETRVLPVVQKIKAGSKQSKGLLKSFFSDPVEKKIARLLDNPGMGSIDFEGGTIKDVDLSGSSHLSADLNFNRSVVQNCDFSNTSFSNTSFKKTIFYNVNLENTKFESTCFDGAVFINVNARAASFDQNRFQGTAIYNCNFNDALMKDVSFFDSTILKTSFNRCDLLCASFAFCEISGVSFVTAHIDQADFSYVKARFCRLPSNLQATIRKENMDFNARKFQFSFKDMPKLNPVMVQDIDILTFSEFIHYGENKFLKQNKISLLTALDIFKPAQSDLFQIVPLLLHQNFSFPGLEQVNPLTPCGISDYQPGLEAIDILKKYVQIKDKNDLTANNNPMIEGIFTIGSVGSIAQTIDSDIDYWVCINEAKMTGEDIKHLDQKLDLLEKMIALKFETQVTFFKVDILRAKNNDFGDSTIESSGSAQARILKEEFYRTMIHVAGKIPLWAVLPTAISLQYYNIILKHTGHMPDLSRYIDLGDIHAISTSEYFGASIWQMFKWLKSPFKSVIKMALLEKYINEYGRESLLCNKYKDEWMNSGTHLKLAQNDSYFILLNNLLLYYTRAKDNDSVSLLLTCFFLKLEISKDAQIENTVFGLRKILLDKCIEKWGWNKKKIFSIGGFKTWQYSQITALSSTIEKYMFKKYKVVNKAFESLFNGRSQISPEDWTVLGRKVFIEFSKQPGKVQKILLVSRGDSHFHGLHLKYSNPLNKVGTWELINKNAKMMKDQGEQLIQAKTIEEIGAWLINNSLYNENSIINLVPNPTYVTHDDIRKLYKALYTFFSSKLYQIVSFDQLLVKAQVADMFISINFYAPKQQNVVTEYTIIYLNTWGEMFCKSVYHPNGFSGMESVKSDILKKLDIKKLPENTSFYFSKGIAR